MHSRVFFTYNFGDFLDLLVELANWVYLNPSNFLLCGMSSESSELTQMQVLCLPIPLMNPTSLLGRKGDSQSPQQKQKCLVLQNGLASFLKGRERSKPDLKHQWFFPHLQVPSKPWHPFFKEKVLWLCKVVAYICLCVVFIRALWYLKAMQMQCFMFLLETLSMPSDFCFDFCLFLYWSRQPPWAFLASGVKRYKWTK